jgi:2-haloalkanoic acid dehalogenase type II
VGTLKIKAVILDFGGTLSEGELDWEPYHEAIRVILASRGSIVDMGQLKKALRAALGELNKVRVLGKEMTFEDVYSDFLRRLSIASNDDILKELHEAFRKYYRAEFLPCVEDVLKTLSSKYKVALLSNTMSDQPRRLLHEYNYEKYFDIILHSRDIGTRKPNPETFRYVLRKLKVQPDEAVHVGDSVEADMIGAQETGITGIWIKSSDQPPWSGYAIKNICELPSLLDKIDQD